MESGEKIVTIQQTSKRYKAAQLAGVVAMCLGVVSCADNAHGYSTFFWVTGVALYIYSRFGAWWTNG